MYQTVTWRGPRRTRLLRILLSTAAVIAAWPFLVGPASAGEPKADLYVSLQGNDAWSGSQAVPDAGGTDGPLATIQHAQKVVRRLKQQGDRNGPIVVAIRGGTYFFSQPLHFGPEDTGTAKVPIVYQAYGEERPVLSGGVKLNTWQVSPDGRWHTLLADVKAGKWSFTQLFVNDQRRFRPRLPRHGYYTIAREIPPTEKAGRKWNDRFGYAGNDVRAEWAGGDVEIVPFCAWFAARRHLGAVDPAERVVTLAEVDKWPDCMPLPKGERFLVDNVREALGEPGDWYLDRRSGELTYVPAPGEQPQKTTVIAPRAERLLVIEGDLKNHYFVEHLRFLGLTLAHSNWVMTSRGQACGQSESNMDGAVSVIGGRNLVFDGCAVRHVGTYAMAFGSGCRDNLIENCELFDMAAGGLKIGHAGDGPVPRGGDPELLASHHTVRQCLVAHGGRMHAEAAGIWIGDCPYNVVEHNEIYDFYQIGVSLGWTWGYYGSQAHHNDVGYNHIHTLGQGVLSDMAAVYTLGVSPGTRIHDNRCHDILCYSRGYGGWGLYTDEGSSDIVIENNLVYRAYSGSFHQHYGRENRVRNNIFACATEGQIQRTRSEPHIPIFFERNIVYWNNKSQVLGNYWDNQAKFDYNLYWNPAGKPIRFFDNATSFQQWQEQFGQDQHSLVVDPLFVAPEKDDFRLKEGSPALAIGFKPFDFSKVGRTRPATLTGSLPPVPKAFE